MTFVCNEWELLMLIGICIMLGMFIGIAIGSKLRG